MVRHFESRQWILWKWMKWRTMFKTHSSQMHASIGSVKYRPAFTKWLLTIRESFLKGIGSFKQGRTNIASSVPLLFRGCLSDPGSTPAIFKVWRPFRRWPQSKQPRLTKNWLPAKLLLKKNAKKSSGRKEDILVRIKANKNLQKLLNWLKTRAG